MLISYILFFCCLHLSKISSEVVDKVIDIDIQGVTTCKESVDGVGSLETVFNTDPKSVDLNVHIPTVLTDEDSFILKIQQYNEDKQEWEDQGNEKTGNICQYVKQFMSKAYDKMKSQTDPPLTEDCYVPAGDYILKNFQANSEDVVVPVGLMGQFKFDVTFFSEEKPLFCFEVQATIS